MSFRESNFLVVCMLGEGLRNEVPLNSAIITTVLHVYYYQCLSYETMATLKRSPNNRVIPRLFYRIHLKIQTQPHCLSPILLSSLSPEIIFHQFFCIKLCPRKPLHMKPHGFLHPGQLLLNTTLDWHGAADCRATLIQHEEKKMMMLPGWLESDFMGKSE